jgi:hypothetical protein
VVEFFKPWLAYLFPKVYTHERPTPPGELLWYAMLAGKEKIVESGVPFEHDGKMIQPKSRTFIPATLKDNPILEATGYGATIDALPEPLRSLMRGDFSAKKAADPYRLIDPALVRSAQARWVEKPPRRQLAIGVDVARGGDCQTVIAPLHGEWFAPLLKVPGIQCQTGADVAAAVLTVASSGVVGVDVIGVGSSAFDSMCETWLTVMPINFAESTDYTDRSGKMRFRNLRAAAYWLFRESLEDNIPALPPDEELVSELCSIHWLPPVGGRIGIEDKDGITKRLGRSPDSADAVVIAWITQMLAARLEEEQTQVIYDPVRIG